MKSIATAFAALAFLLIIGCKKKENEDAGSAAVNLIGVWRGPNNGLHLIQQDSANITLRSCTCNPAPASFKRVGNKLVVNNEDFGEIIDENTLTIGGNSYARVTTDDHFDSGTLTMNGQNIAITADSGVCAYQQEDGIHTTIVSTESPCVQLSFVFESKETKNILSAYVTFNEDDEFSARNLQVSNQDFSAERLKSDFTFTDKNNVSYSGSLDVAL